MSTISPTDVTIDWGAEKTTISSMELGGDVCDGQFVVRGQIGRVGMGSVLKVERLSDQKPLALKYCHLAGAELKRFEREVRIMRRVRHPHVVPIVDANLGHSPPYFLMPLAEGS